MGRPNTLLHKRAIHLRDYLAVMNRRKWIVVGALLIVISATILHLKRQVPFYAAQANILIEPNRAQEIMYPRSYTWSRPDISFDLVNQLEVIKTTPVLASAIRRLSLTSAPEGTVEFSEAVSRLKRSVSAGFIGDTTIVGITAVDPVPEKARDKANAVAQAYIDQDRLSRMQSGRDAIGWLSAQLADLKTKLNDSEEAFQQFKEREGIITLDESRREELGEAYRLGDTYLTARADRLGIETIIGKLESDSHALGQDEGSAEMDIPVALLDSPVLQRLGFELSQLKSDLAEKGRVFKDTYPAIIEIKERIRQTEEKILSELRRQRDFLLAQEASLETEQKSKRQQALELSRKELEYLALEREVLTNREMYNVLLSRVKELSVASESNLDNIRIIELAALPMTPMGRKDMTLILGGLLGLFLGVGFAFFLEYLDVTIRTPDDVSQHIGLPVLGVVPRVAKAKKAKVPPIILQEQDDASAEAYRNLRTSLILREPENPMKTIVLTSAGPGEGKSFTTVNLGIALAQAGQDILLVDADMRRPMLHRIFGLDRDRGLSTVLAGDLTVDEALMKTDITNLSVLTAGALPTNPSELLGSAQMTNLIRHVRDQYDMILFDSTPISGMADTRVLGSETDGTILVVKVGSTTRKALNALMEQLEQVGIKVYGVVLNNMDTKRYDYYNYYYYYSYEDHEKVSKNLLDGMKTIRVLRKTRPSHINVKK